MDIGKINSMIPQLPEITGGEEAPASAEGSFGSFLKKSISDTNESLQSADAGAKALAVGKTENLHEAMIGFEKAETALKLLVQVRNKALEAYNQVLAMQV